MGRRNREAREDKKKEEERGGGRGERAEEREGWRQEKKQQQEEQRKKVERSISKINPPPLGNKHTKALSHLVNPLSFPETQVLYNSSQHSKTEYK